MAEIIATTTEKPKRNVCHVKMTNIAYAPDFLVKCINKYGTRYNAFLIGPDGLGADESWGPRPTETLVDPDVPVTYLSGILNFEQLDKVDYTKYHIVHYHNKHSNVFNGPKLIQYHSEGYITYLDFPGYRTVISQFQALLPEYKGCGIVRNIIDLYSDPYDKPYYPEKIRIGFSPSILKSLNGSHADKGAPRTLEILNKLKQRYPEIEIDIITKQTIPNCMNRKNKCNILIDECVTSSYHRSGLEALALGKVTICSVSNEVSDLMKKVTGSPKVPFENIWIAQLEKGLEELICQGAGAINEMGKENKEWFEKYWNPKDIVREFEDIYDKIIDGSLK